MITQDIANNLLTLSSLSLLGIGVQPYVDKDGKNLELNITRPASSAGGNSALNELL